MTNGPMAGMPAAGVPGMRKPKGRIPGLCASLCALPTLLGSVIALPGAATAQDRVVFTEYRYEDPTLKAMDLDGANLGEYFDPGYEIPPADWLTVGLALDEAAGKIYWVHGSTPGRIRRANLDGSGQELLVSGLKLPRGLALDTRGGKMYWSASPPAGNAGGLIQRANLDGSGLETVYLDPEYDPVSSKIGRPRVDAVNGWVYFAGTDRILRINLDGPPFVVYTVVTGVSTARAVALDVANERIYWIGADTIEDVVCRARLDNSDYEVVFDLSPNTGNSNGLSDLVLDLAGATYLLCDDLRHTVMRGDLGGLSCETIYTSPAGWAPSAMTLDANVPQPMLDCNGNGRRDLDDVMSGASEDCNDNGIPDECEDDPCVPPAYLLDQSLNPTQPGRQLGGAPENQRWIIFQPFDVPAGGWQVGEIRLHGVTWTYRDEGFTATIMPDDGAGHPDESQPLAAGDAFFRFGAEWVSVPVAVSLPAGRHWVRLTANDANSYVASVSTVAAGLPSMSRSGLGNEYYGRPPIGLRILSAGDQAGVAPAAPGESGGAALAAGGESFLRLASSSPAAHSHAGPTLLEFAMEREGVGSLAVYDPQGRCVRTLREGWMGAGAHRALWDGLDDRGAPVAAGMYLARLRAAGELHTARILRLR